MLGINCLLKDTQLFLDLSNFTKKLIASRVVDGLTVDIQSIYRAVKSEANQWDIDMDTAGEIYKDVAGQFNSKDVRVSTDKEVDAFTGSAVKKAVKELLFNRKPKPIQEVEGNRPSMQEAIETLQLFNDDFYPANDDRRKTVMLQMQEALGKSAKALLQRQGKVSTGLTATEMINNALAIDEMSFTDLKGNLNKMDDLFNQYVQDIDLVIKELIASKKGMTQAKKDEIDEKVQLFRNYTQNIVQGAYTLALSKPERRKIIQEILKPEYGKDIVRAGVTKRVLDYNKMSKDGANFEIKAKEELVKSGYTEAQSDKIVAALKEEFQMMRESAQYNNIASIGIRRAVEDDTFLSNAAAQVVMSKNNGAYKIFNRELNRYVPDWVSWEADFGTNQQQIKETIKADILKSGSATEYRQIISELQGFNNPANNIKKGELEKLQEMQKRHAFDPLFNAKLMKTLGLSEKDADLLEVIEAKVIQMDEIIGKSGRFGKEARGEVQNAINELIQKKAKKKSWAYYVASALQFGMQQRNAIRLINIYNGVQNNLFGLLQTATGSAMTPTRKLAMLNFKATMSVVSDVFKGGQHFDIVEGERLGLMPTNYRFDSDKGLEHNTKAVFSFLPNAILGVMDAASHYATFMGMLQKGLVLHEKSRLMSEKRAELIGLGLSVAEADAEAKKSEKEFNEQAIDLVTDHFFNEQYIEEARQQAKDTFAMIKSNVSNAQIEREAMNLVIGRLAQGDDKMMRPERLEAIVKAANTASLKAIGKGVAVGIQPFRWVEERNIEHNKKLKADLEAGQYNKAALRMFSHSILVQGLFPFVRGAFNFTVIGIKQSGLGLARAISLNKKSFREQVANVANNDNKNLEEVLESYFSRKQDIGYAIQGLMLSALVFAYYAIKKAADDDEEDESYFNYLDEQMKELAKSKKATTMLRMWGPTPFRIYNILSGNTSNKPADQMKELMAMGGGEVIIPNFVKDINRAGGKHWSASIGNFVTSPFEVGSVFMSPKSWVDAFSAEENKAKAAIHDVYIGPEDNEFVNGLLAGLMGYGLNKQINYWEGYIPKK